MSALGPFPDPPTGVTAAYPMQLRRRQTPTHYRFIPTTAAPFDMDDSGANKLWKKNRWRHSWTGALSAHEEARARDSPVTKGVPRLLTRKGQQLATPVPTEAPQTKESDHVHEYEHRDRS